MDVFGHLTVCVCMYVEKTENHPEHRQVNSSPPSKQREFDLFPAFWCIMHLQQGFKLIDRYPYIPVF